MTKIIIKVTHDLAAIVDAERLSNRGPSCSEGRLVEAVGDGSSRNALPICLDRRTGTFLRANADHTRHTSPS